mmetsp:Transcript_50408/g.94152  ORF Transcript_50408/g.94152 Transcript_50408/m.94152 type:complete len:138 (+) Transcript_50408:263-676(+)
MGSADVLIGCQKACKNKDGPFVGTFCRNSLLRGATFAAEIPVADEVDGLGDAVSVALRCTRRTISCTVVLTLGRCDVVLCVEELALRRCLPGFSMGARAGGLCDVSCGAWMVDSVTLSQWPAYSLNSASHLTDPLVQ